MLNGSEMLQRFSRYLGVGVINTLIHWAVFLLLHMAWGFDQAASNVMAFAVAVTFSFFANAAFTFQVRATSVRYALFVIFMGGVSLGVGWLADRLMLSPWVTLVAFSALSLVLGFIYSHYIVFRRPA
ncbi:GtrA family protein [Halomonas sp. WWR20]